jgi:hypothetical protein
MVHIFLRLKGVFRHLLLGDQLAAILPSSQAGASPLDRGETLARPGCWDKTGARA